MSKFVHLNGDIVPIADARINAFDDGLLFGAGLFETMRAYNGRIFRLQAHLDRLIGSIDALDMNISREFLPTEKDFAALLEANKMRNARVRLTVTPGPSSAMHFSEDAPEPTIAVAVLEIAPQDREQFETGFHVLICPYLVSPSDPLVRHKTLCYFGRLLGMDAAARRQCADALWFTTDRRLAESCIANVFIVHDGIVKTPPPDTPVLPGVCRAAVLEIAAGEGINAQETEIVVDDVLAATEVFLTNSIMEVMPVTLIEKHRVGDGAAGPLTRRLAELYGNLVERECGGDG